jgi:pentatricopeptide repeat protein
MARPSPQHHPAIESLKEKVAKDPFSRAFLQLAEEYRKTGRFEDAVQVCLDGLARHPTYHTARIALGRTYLEAGNLDAARRALAEVLEMSPENHLAGRLLAEVQRKIGDTQGAAETYRTILRHYPADKEVEALLRDLTRPAPSPGAPSAPPVPAPGPQPIAPAPVPAPVKMAAPVAAPPMVASPVTPAPRPAGASRPGVMPDTAIGEPSFDYRFEDLGLPAPAPMAPPAAPKAPAREDGADELQTNTLAELYLRQGLVDKALEVYRAMLRFDPENARVRQRLQELGGEAGMTGSRPPTPAPVAPDVFDAPAPAALAGASAGPNAERIERLRRFLRAVQVDRPGKAAPR